MREGGRDAARDEHAACCIGHVMGRKVPIVQVEFVGPVLAERVEADVSVTLTKQMYGCFWMFKIGRSINIPTNFSSFSCFTPKYHTFYHILHFSRNICTFMSKKSNHSGQIELQRSNFLPKMGRF